MFEIEISKAAGRTLRKADAKRRTAIRAAIAELAADPTGHRNVKKLAATENRYRLRVGKYRVLFVVKAEARRIEITGIGTRGDVYK